MTDIEKPFWKVEEGCCYCGCGKPSDQPLLHGHKVTYLDKLNYRSKYKVESRGYDTPCWIWQLYISPHGYGRWSQRAAHRKMYELLVGDIPEGDTLDHLCNQRTCVNPDHLLPCSMRDNNKTKFLRIEIDKVLREIERLEELVSQRKSEV